MFFNRTCGCGRQMPQMEQPVMEPAITKCVEKEFYHEVNQYTPLLIYQLR